MSYQKKSITLTSSCIQTPLGNMFAIADDTQLYFLDFIDRKKYDAKLALLQTKTNAIIIPGSNHIITLITQELTAYFAGALKVFTTPIFPLGSPFQNKAWKTLTEIPYGQTRTYAQEAVMIGNKKASRAVASANSNNTLAIIIPCHRVIASTGKLSGYAGGTHRKEWLIQHEKLTSLS